MYKSMLLFAAETCLELGHRVLAKLSADTRLVDAASLMTEVQQSLERRLGDFLGKRKTERNLAAVRDDAQRKLVDSLRTLGANLVALSGGHHDSDLCLRYFPQGYGKMIHDQANQICQLAEVILGKLVDEVDEWVRSFRERIDQTYQGLVAAQAQLEALTRDRQESFQYLRTEVRHWVAGISRAKLRAFAVLLDEPRYLKEVFDAVARRKNSGASNDGSAGDDPPAEGAPGATPPEAPGPTSPAGNAIDEPTVTAV